MGKKRGPRILCWDIESTNLNATFGTILCIGYKWFGESKVTVPTILDHTKRGMLDDEGLVHDFVENVYNEADYTIAHYGCVAPDRKILTADLRWVAAGDLMLGDTLVGMDAQSPGERRRRRFRESCVTHTGLHPSRMLRIIFEDGSETEVTPSHPFTCAKSPAGNNLVWRKAEELSVGDRVQKLFEPWQEHTSFDAGWLSGMFDGEGSLSQNSPCSGHIGGVRLTIGQKSGPVFDRIGETLHALGFQASAHRSHRDVWTWQVTGGRPEHTRLLGSIRPGRLLAKFKPDLMGRANGWFVRIAAIEDTKGEYVALSTSTETYVADGYAAHNSRFDLPMVQAKCLKYGLSPPATKPMIDTWRVARRELKLHSNRLAVLSEFLGVEHSKTPIIFDDWLRAAHGEKRALRSVVHHCKMDVLVLEEVYQRLKPYCKEEPSIRLFKDLPEVSCPSCGSDHLQMRGYQVARTRRYRRYHCQDCGKWSRSRAGEGRAEVLAY